MQRIHIALEQAGTIGGAASLLGMTRDTLANIVNDHPELRSYLEGAAPPTEEQAMVRKPIQPGATTKEVVQVAKQMDADLRAGFESLGMDADAVKQAMSFKAFGELHFKDTRHYIGGGITKLFADLMAEIDEIRREIGTNSDIEAQRMLREDRSRCIQHAISVFDRVRQTTVDAAMIEAKKREAKEKKKGGRPAFAALMSVNGNVTVQSQNPEAEKGE
jgi:hypothetical protein